MNPAIVTAADSGYFPYLLDLLRSIRAHRPGDRPTPDVCVLDTGLTPAQREEIGSLATRFVQPGWDVSTPPSTPSWFKAMTARPYLPSHFPDYDAFVWLDADTWLQDWRAMGLLLQSATTGATGVVPEIHRAYAYLYRWAGEGSPQLYQSYLPFGQDIAGRMVRMPIINSGVFAAARDAPLWAAWQRRLRQGIIGQPFIRTIEQAALNASLYADNVPFQPLPAWCNWICYHARPSYRTIDGTLGEAFPPFEKLSILHHCGVGRDAIALPTDAGGQAMVPLSFSAFQAFARACLP